MTSQEGKAGPAPPQAPGQKGHLRSQHHDSRVKGRARTQPGTRRKQHRNMRSRAKARPEQKQKDENRTKAWPKDLREIGNGNVRLRLPVIQGSPGNLERGGMEGQAGKTDPSTQLHASAPSAKSQEVGAPCFRPAHARKVTPQEHHRQAQGRKRADSRISRLFERSFLSW